MTLTSAALTTAMTSLTAVVAALITAMFARRSHRDSTLRSDLTRLREEVAELRTEVNALRRENRLQSDYILDLRGDGFLAGIDVRDYPAGLRP